uniref:RNA polymerase N 8 kDa subunit n=1 Tax=Pithovirus LCPAC101 TaxID=2506586 RepID=A0A481Z2J9_9VIRU|nr:MAG: RNA polymerase N 8 kDa subunit [Pithovirus LCPAC101]
MELEPITPQKSKWKKGRGTSKSLQTTLINTTNLPDNIFFNLNKELQKSDDKFKVISDHASVLEDPDFMVLLPTSCYGCGKPLAAKQEMFVTMQKGRGESFSYIMQHLGIFRLCCKRHFMSPAVIPMGARKHPEADISIRDVSPNVNKFLIGSVTSMRLSRLKNTGTAQYSMDARSIHTKSKSSASRKGRRLSSLAPMPDIDFLLPNIDDQMQFITPSLSDLPLTMLNNL